MELFDVGNIVGERISLQSAISKKRFKAQIIGFLNGKSLIISKPVGVDGLSSLVEDEELIVRFFANGFACGFKSNLICNLRSPYSHSHLTYPSAFMAEKIRSDVRVKTIGLAATVQFDYQAELDVKVKDISSGGIMVSINSEAISNCLVTETALTVKLQIPVENHVSLAPISQRAVLRTIQTTANGNILLGLKFDDLKEADISTIQHYIGTVVCHQQRLI
jgi:c-di-GMP-binding flagellar brake protein YcgR